MKCLLLADDRLDLQTKLEPILKHWGYDVVSTGDVEQTCTALREKNPALVLIATNLLGNPRLTWPSPPPPIIALAHPDAAGSSPQSAATLPVPVDIFELYRQLQIQIETPPRKNLRLRLRLPGMYSQDRKSVV